MKALVLAFVCAASAAHAQTAGNPNFATTRIGGAYVPSVPGPFVPGHCVQISGTPTQPTIVDAGAACDLTATNLQPIPALTTTVKTTASTIYPMGTYVSVRLASMTIGVAITCTGDGTTPIGNIGSSVTASYGQTIVWPDQPGGAMPTAAVQCIASSNGTIQAEAH